MVTKVRSWLATGTSWVRLAWPFVGSLYLGYLALQSPPARYVGLVGLVFVLPLLAGWVAGLLFGVGPWADDDGDPDATTGEGDPSGPDDPGDPSGSGDGQPD